MRCWNDGRHSGGQRFRVHGVQGSGVQEFTSWRYDLPADYWDKYLERITAVTPAQVQAAAKKYLDPPRLQIVAVGDPTKVGETLKGFGTVETYDTEGKRVTSTSSQ
jgi:hypothetical protein